MFVQYYIYLPYLWECLYRAELFITFCHLYLCTNPLCADYELKIICHPVSWDITSGVCEACMPDQVQTKEQNIFFQKDGGEGWLCIKRIANVKIK